MQRTRVVLVEMPHMIGDIVRDALANQADIELVADVPTCDGAPVVIRESGADVVVVGRELSEAAGVDVELLCACPDTTVLVVTQDGRRAFRHEPRPKRIPLTNHVDGVSPQDLVDAIRVARGRRALRPD